MSEQVLATEKLLTINQILGVDDTRFVDVDVPEWGGTVRISIMPGTVRDSFEAEASRRQNSGASDLGSGFRALFLATVLVDTSGERIFRTEEDITKLNAKNGVVLRRLFKMAQDINGYSEEGQEGLMGNSAADQSVGYGSDLLDN